MVMEICVMAHPDVRESNAGPGIEVRHASRVHNRYCVLLIACLLLASAHEAKAEDWKLKKENATLKIYSSAIDHSAYKAVRVECVVKGTFSQVIAVLFDVDRQKDWVFNDKYSKLVKKLADNELIYYSEVNVPWPLANRDFVAHIKVTQPSPNVVTILSSAAPDMVPEKEGIVRIHNSSSKWTMTAIGNGRIHIDYVVQLDPGGSVPAWLANMFVVKGPCETFEQMQIRMGMPAYRNAHFDFIKE